MQYKIWFVMAGMTLGTGCGLLPKNPEVEPAFAIIYSKWLADAARYETELTLDGLTISMSAPGLMAANTVGTCGPNRRIIISREWWDYHPYGGDREALVYHELGHCTLGQDHRPNSIMQPYGLSGYTYRNDEEDYLAEIFSYGRNPLNGMVAPGAAGVYHAPVECNDLHN